MSLEIANVFKNCGQVFIYYAKVLDRNTGNIALVLSDNDVINFLNELIIKSLVRFHTFRRIFQLYFAEGFPAH